MDRRTKIAPSASQLSLEEVLASYGIALATISRLRGLFEPRSRGETIVFSQFSGRSPGDCWNFFWGTLVVTLTYSTVLPNTYDYLRPRRRRETDPRVRMKHGERASERLKSLPSQS